MNRSADCLSWDIGPSVGSLTVRAIPGLPVTWVLDPVDGYTPASPVIEVQLSDRSVLSFPLVDGRVTVADTTPLQDARRARLVDQGVVVAAGRFWVISGWDADYTDPTPVHRGGPGWDIGPSVGSLTARAIPGLPVTWVLDPVDGYTPVAPVIEVQLADRSVLSFPLVNGQVTVAETTPLQNARRARLVDQGVVVAAGRFRAISGWDADCTGGSVPVRFVAGAPGVGIASVTDLDGDGVALVTFTDGTTSGLPLPPGPPGPPGPGSSLDDLEDLSLIYHAATI